MKYLVLTAFLFVGCGSDDSGGGGGSDNQPGLNGIWSNMVEYTVFDEKLVIITKLEFTETNYKRVQLSASQTTGLRTTYSAGTYVLGDENIVFSVSRSTCPEKTDITGDLTFEQQDDNILLNTEIYEPDEGGPVAEPTVGNIGCARGTDWVESPVLDI